LFDYPLNGEASDPIFRRELVGNGAHKSAGFEILMIRQISQKKLQAMGEQTAPTRNLITIEGDGQNAPASLGLWLFAASYFG
jgi:hypothetical protein